MGAEKIIPLIGILGVGGLAAHYYSSMGVEKNISPLRNTSFAPKTPEELAEIETIKEQAIAEYKENNEEIVDTWTEYLPSIPYGPQYFENFMDDEFEEDNPFPQNGRKLVGPTEWVTTSQLKIIDRDVWGKQSGGCHIKINKGYEVIMKIETENGYYFENDVSLNGDEEYSLIDYANDLDNETEAGNWFNTNSSVSVPLIGDKGDYISVDIDSEHDGIGKFVLKTNGRKYWHDGSKPDDNVFITLEQINRRNPNYDKSQWSAESYTFNAGSGLRRIGSLGDLWKGVQGLASAINPIKMFSKAKQTAVIPTTSFKVGDKVGDSGKVAEDGYKLTEGMLSSGDTSNLKYVKSFNEGTGFSKLEEGVALRKANGKVVGYSGSAVKIQKGDELIKLGDAAADTGSGFGNAINLRNAGRAVLVTGTGATIGAIFTIADMIPGLLGDGFEDLACSLTGSCCEEKCEESDNPDCVAECQEAADDKAVKFGGLVVVGILGLVVILKGSKSKKSAEEYYVVKEV